MPCPSFEGEVVLQLHARGLLGSLVVESTCLAWVSAATFQHPDGEIAHFIKYTWGVHSSLFVASRHGLDLVFCRLGHHDLLVVSRSCRQVLLIEFILICQQSILAPRRYIVYYLSIHGGQIYLFHASVLVMPTLFIKSKRTISRLPMGCCSPCQCLLDGSNLGAQILFPPYHCILA